MSITEGNGGNGGNVSEEAPYAVHFDRLSVERRVLGTITDEDHVGRGPRNTLDRLVVELTEDPHTPYSNSRTLMQNYLTALSDAGLVAQREDETYEVTDLGRTELQN